MKAKLSKKTYPLNWSFKISKVAIIGAGLSGLTAAIRLAEQGIDVHIFEAAAKAGGRTRSFYESKVDCLCDNGPHLLLGAYQSTRKLLADCNIAQHVRWQKSLHLPLWDQPRGTFHLKPTSWLPFHLSLLKAVNGLPGHNKSSALAMVKLATTLKSNMDDTCTVETWLNQLSMPTRLIRDLIEPLCLGSMNEAMHTANALSFRRVLHESFKNHKQAQLGWFTKPLDEALITPLCQHAQKLGVSLHTRNRIRHWSEDSDGKIQLHHQSFQHVIVALPAYATDRLFAQPANYTTRAICNVHLWFDQKVNLPALFVGAIGTTGQWFFDVSAQMQETKKTQHICAVISADHCTIDDLKLVQVIGGEIRKITRNATLQPIHYRIIREKRATVLVRPTSHSFQLPHGFIDASERPQPGELPATIELAIQRGEQAARSLFVQFQHG